MANSNRKLDIVLKHLNDCYDQSSNAWKFNPYTGIDEKIEGIDRQTKEEVMTAVVLDLKRQTIDIQEFDLILEYLRSKGYIEKIEDRYRILYEGKVLIENGGFTQMEKDKIKERQIREDLLQKQQDYEVQMKHYQMWNVIAVLVAGSFYLKELVVWVLHLLCSCA